MLDFAGFLFIGDPHVCSKKIGRRKDNYLDSVLDKLSHCAEICTREKLVPVILGDLFHRQDDSGLKMLNRLVRVLKEFPCAPLVLEGNHDKLNSTLGDEDSLALLNETNVISVVGADTTSLEFDFEGAPVRLLAYAHGVTIPDKVAPFIGTTFAITHHDLAFETSYPGSLPLKPIENCDVVVNGHMHDTKKSVTKEKTVWHNPGNIEPLSVDLKDHVPRAWRWTPLSSGYSLEAIELPHGKDLFDLTGIQVEAVDAEELNTEKMAPLASQFAQLLQTQASLDAARTDDASVLLEDLNEILQAAGVSEATKLLMQSLATEMVLETVS